MTKKSEKIELMLKELPSAGSSSRHNPHYLGYFECFNSQMHYEAHDVLEDFWLRKKGAPEYLFYKGLIQLAGAFVHAKKSKLNPASRLLKLAKTNLTPYSPRYEDLDVHEVLERINEWIRVLESSEFTRNIYDPAHPPSLHLIQT